MPIVIAKNPLYSVAIGSGQCLEEFDVLKQVLISAARAVTGRPPGRGRVPALAPPPLSPRAPAS